MNDSVRMFEGSHEVTAVVRERTVELFVPAHGFVLAAHVPFRLLARLALWLIWHWIWAQKCGLRPWVRSRALRQQVLGDGRA